MNESELKIASMWADLKVMPAAVVAIETIDAARAGERHAFATLWRTHQAHLLRYLRTKRTAQPEDVASQVWIDVAGSIARFEGDGDDFRAWLFTIAHRRSVDAVRSAVRRPEVLDNRAGTVQRDPHSDEAIEASGALERAIELVQLLSPEMAEAVMLRVVYDMSFEQVADVMQRTEGSVRVLVHRGLKKLRSHLRQANELQESASS